MGKVQASLGRSEPAAVVAAATAGDQAAFAALTERYRRELQVHCYRIVGYFLFVAQYLQLVVGLSPLRAGLWSRPRPSGSPSAPSSVPGSLAAGGKRWPSCPRPGQRPEAGPPAHPADPAPPSNLNSPAESETRAVHLAVAP